MRKQFLCACKYEVGENINFLHENMGGEHSKLSAKTVEDLRAKTHLKENELQEWHKCT